MKILVIIPCYNEEENIEHVINYLKHEAPLVDYLIVNDCSTDKSELICKQNGYNYISLPVNLGIGGGVQSGYLYAKDNGYDIAIQMDGDGQHDAAFLKDVIAPVESGELDMCIGSRFITKEGFQTSFMRRFGISIISNLIFILCKKRIKDTTSGFRACNKKLINFYAENYAQDYPEPEAIIAAVISGYKVGERPVIMRERLGGVSSISTFKSAYYMIKVTIALVVYRITIKKVKGGDK